MNLKTLSKKKFAVVSKRRSQNMAVKKLALKLMPKLEQCQDCLGQRVKDSNYHCES